MELHIVNDTSVKDDQMVQIIASMDDNIIAGVILGAFSFTAMVTYTPIIYILIQMWRESKNHFILLLIFLALTDNIQLMLYFGYATPCTFLGRRIYGYDMDAFFFGTLNNMSYFAGLAQLVNIGINRYWSICKKHTYKITYTKKAILCSISLCYGFGLISAIPQLTSCCPLRYWYDGYSFGYDMDPNAPYVWYDRTVTTTTFISGGFLYAGIFMRIRQAKLNLVQAGAQQTDTRRENTNKRLAIQSALVFGIMFLGGLGFTVIPLLTPDKWWALVSAGIMVATSGIQPIIYMVFNEQVQKKAKALFLCRNNAVRSIHTSNHINGQGQSNGQNVVTTAFVG